MATQPGLHGNDHLALAGDQAEIERQEQQIAELLQRIKPVAIKGEPLSETIIRLRGED